MCLFCQAVDVISDSTVTGAQTSAVPIYIYVWSRVSGMLTLASPGAGGGGTGYSDAPSLSDNGQVVAYESGAADLVSGVTRSEERRVGKERRCGGGLGAGRKDTRYRAGDG